MNNNVKRIVIIAMCVILIVLGIVYQWQSIVTGQSLFESFVE